MALVSESTGAREHSLGSDVAIRDRQHYDKGTNRKNIQTTLQPHLAFEIATEMVGSITQPERRDNVQLSLCDHAWQRDKRTGVPFSKGLIRLECQYGAYSVCVLILYVTRPLRSNMFIYNFTVI